MANGIIVINKGEGISSQGVVNRVKKIFGEAKAGHTGTLDPLATGVLPVLLGRGVKASEYMLTSDKFYRAGLTLGITTDTEDITGDVLTRCHIIPEESQVLDAIQKFIGNIKQVPPMYSALKVGGKKLCDLARSGITIDRTPRDITVHSIKAVRESDTKYILDVHCSKGTYIRTLCADIGRALGVGGVMHSLCRTKASVFTLEDSYTLEALEAMSREEREKKILPVELVFKDLLKVELPPFFAHLAECGVEIYLKKLGLSLALGTRVRLVNEDGFFALGEVREFDTGLAIKPIKQFGLLK